MALIAIMAVQLYWLFNAAKIEEEHFNNEVNKALTEAKHEIGKTARTCTDMNNFLCGVPAQEEIRKQKIAQIDSIIRSKLEHYNIELEYTFAVTEQENNEKTGKIFGQKCYLQCLNGLLQKDGIKILLEFPGRNQFLLSQLRGSFLLAFFSIIFVMVSYLITARMFRNERLMMEQTSDFINNMVHEFQTPLSNIRFAASLIKKREAKIDDPKISEYLSVIINENHKMENNVVEILKISGNENGHQKETFDLNKIIEQVCADFYPRTESLNGDIQFIAKQAEIPFTGVSNHFKLITSNLIDNALKYSLQAPKINISTEIKNANIVLKVHDNGIGIEKKHINRIFEKYYRVPTGDLHNVKGFGLGLTYVRKIVDQYNGKIEVTSTKDEGTVFTIFLPLKNETHKNTIG
jgi:two-component system phosphate regulon sensor histidine kinase PhoR